MANFSRLRDLYSLPGFTPAASIRGVFGDPYAVIIDLRRRRKKRTAAIAAPAIAPSTIKLLDAFATSIAAADASTSRFSFDASSVPSAKP
jgi:hypothetical protein